MLFRSIWRCNQKYEAETTCSTPNLNESAIEAAFVEAFNQMLGDKEQYIARFDEMLPLLANTTELETRMAEAQTKHEGLMDNLRLYMEVNTRQIQDQEEYNCRFSELDAECKKSEAHHHHVHMSKLVSPDIFKTNPWRPGLCS